ncbi:MAG: YibE/F family protein, partial [Oscillospiraceae bacterium]|nr:YibE/F family protein [Oscillospiraceae bacterium]
ISGIAIALLFGLMAQSLARVSGLRISDVEPLLQLRQTGVPIKLRGLLVGGITISALGAVMDVAMSLSSALTELKDVNPSMGKKALFRSGMNIGRDMVGTMTNTLILAFIGSSFVLIIYLYSLGLQPHLLLSSAFLSIEVISGVASSIGVILSVPITALISSVIITRTAKEAV